MPAGYSGKPLVQKLGIKEGWKIAILAAPKDFAKTLGKLPAGVTLSKQLHGPLDFIQYFAKSKADLEKIFPELKQALSQNGSLWISWPKGSSGVATDLNENIVRDIGLANGIVDVKVCAVDETWSGLKFVFRLKDRT
jgi:hypothetical protein